MARTTYKPLYKLTHEEILKNISFPSADTQTQLSTSQYPFITGGTVGSSSVDIHAIINAIVDVLEGALPSRIISGLSVFATDPISDSVTIFAGKGTVRGRVYEIRKNITLKIPFDVTLSVFNIFLTDTGVKIGHAVTPNSLLLAKIVVPKPGVTNRVKDRRGEDDDWDAYIVNFKELNLYQDPYGHLEEDSIDILRDSIGDILADNIIGDLKLSENLKILNTAGTLELNSDSMKLYDLDENMMAKFNRYGTFFYDTDGIELAKFSTTEARVGNIKILTNAIQSGNFISGTLGRGFRIRDNGDAEFNNIVARGKITTSVFEKATISSVGGSFMVIDSDVLDKNFDGDQNYLTISGDTTFAVGDILRIKNNTDDEYLEVLDIADAPRYTVDRDKLGNYNNLNPSWEKGTAIVNYGASGEGGIFMTASENDAPYIDFFTHTGTPWDTTTIKTRIGNLDGVPGCSGYGIYGGDGYLGALQIIDILQISSQGAIRSNLTGSYPYVEFSQSGLMLKTDDSGATYGTAQYGETSGTYAAKYGYGALAWIMNSDLEIPFAVLKEQNVADIRLYNRDADPVTGDHEVGDLIVTRGFLKICDTAGSPGAFKGMVKSSADTGGSGSAGAGKQYIEIEVPGGLRYKVLHDGQV